MQAEQVSPSRRDAPNTLATFTAAPETAPLPRWFTPQSSVFQATILLAAIAVIAAASLLELRGTTRIALPGSPYVLPELCTLKRNVGIPCPGCGMTRAFVCLAHGDVAAAWRFNPVALIAFGVVVAQIPYRVVQIARLATTRRALELPGTPLAACVLAAALLMQWAWRIWP